MCLLNTQCSAPHVDVEGLWFVDLEASRPGTVGGVHETHTQQLVVVIPRPVKHNAGARQGGDVTLRIGRALGGMHYLVASEKQL